MPRQAPQGKQGNSVNTRLPLPKQTPFTQIQTKAQQQQTQISNSGSLQGPSFLKTVKEGFAFGVGSAVARTAVDSFFSGNSKSKVPEPQQPVTGTDSCKHLLETYESCLRLSSQETSCSNEILSYIQCVHRGETPSKPDAHQ